jgi:hypothetical protein
MRRYETVAKHLLADVAAPCGGKATVVSEDLKRFLDTFRGLTKVIIISLSV